MRSTLLFVCLIATAAVAGEERLLVPVQSLDVPGAYGSVWRTTLAITNLSDHSVFVGGLGTCSVNPCPTPPLLAKQTVITGGGYVSFLTVNDTDATAVTFLLRVQDMSRQSQTWGATVPVVREPDAFVNRTVSLVDIPTSPAFRSTLRIYDFDPPNVHQVRIRYYAVDPNQAWPPGAPDQLLVEHIATFSLNPTNPFTEPPLITIALGAEPAINAHDRIRIEIEPITPDLRFWAFVSVTNNETQHVTIISPQ